HRPLGESSKCTPIVPGGPRRICRDTARGRRTGARGASSPQVVGVPAAGEVPACGGIERRQDMSEPSEVRPEVVEAIVGVLKGGDPAELPPGPTAAEKSAAKDTYLSDFVAERGKRDRQSQAWELLLTRSYDEAPSWKQIFDDLDPEGRPELE